MRFNTSFHEKYRRKGRVVVRNIDGYYILTVQIGGQDSSPFNSGRSKGHAVKEAREWARSKQLAFDPDQDLYC